ncbi:MAG: stage 0 sporulation family protein [Clostridia bacterium]|nr:stage 0 sporulation family protein [Clostridia bacterium]
MRTIVGVKYPTGKKVYYFNPNGVEFRVGDNVIVETARGLEYGHVVIANREVEDEAVKHELKPVLRLATAKDEAQAVRLAGMREDAMKIAQQKAEKHKLKLKFVDCVYTFDGKKVLLYFTADGRVDFRELVKDLAATLHARIELCQLFERDDIKMRGALAPCGRPCCCHAFLTDFEKVTIKMAKVQGLSLSPTKISGMCGKLMCCLKYESEYYMEVAKEMPKVKSRVTTPDGEGVVDSLDMIRKEVLVRIAHDDIMEIKRYPLNQLQGYESAGVDETDDQDDTDEIPDGEGDE